MTNTPSFKIAFYKAKYGNWLDKTISIATLSKYSHCEIVFPDGMCASSSPRDGGVRFKRIDLDDHWDVYTLNMVLDSQKINYWFYIHQGEKYDWLGAAGSAVRLDLSSDNKKYCSQACSIVLGLDQHTIDPGRLHGILKDYGYINGW